MLTVAMPVLKQQGALGVRFVSEKPIQLECARVTFPDGTPVTPDHIIKAGFIIRRHQAGGSIESWDEGARKWISSPNVQPQALFHKDNLWQALIVAIGQKDQSDQEKFSTDRATAFPQYSVQCFYQARDSAKQEHNGVSAPSAPVQIGDVGSENRAGLYMKPKMDPVSANEIGMFLKDAALVTERGRISIREEADGSRIEFLCSRSRIEILPSGEIVLTPPDGQMVRIAGNLSIGGTLNAALVTQQGRISIREEAGGSRIELLCSGSRIEILPSGEIVLTPPAGQTVRVAGNLNIGGTLNVAGSVTAPSYL